MNYEEFDVHQKLMDKAYDDERNRADNTNTNWSYNRMLSECNGLERLAVTLGNLNYQVENGGFNQWVDNGYCTGISDAKEALNKLGTETAKQVHLMLEKVEKYLRDEVVSGEAESRGCGGDYYDDDKCGYDSYTCYGCGGSGEVDNPDYDPDDEDCTEDEMIECCECFGSGEVEEEAECPNFNNLDGEDLNSHFYKINEQLLKDITAYINEHQPVASAV